MQKKLIALAVAGLASTAAFAQSNVTVYGIADMYVASSGADGQKRTVSVNSGGWAGSRLGFKGTEDLGNGLKAIFTLEYALAVDANAGVGTGAATARQQFVGLEGGFGKVIAGRLQTAGYDFSGVTNAFHNTAINPMNAVMGLNEAAATNSLINSNSRANNAIAYISPSFGGLTVAYNHVRVSETAFSNVSQKDTTANLISATYTAGPLAVSGIYTKQNNVNTGNVVGATDEVKEWGLGGSYDFGVAKLMGAYQSHQINDNAKNKVWQISGVVPVSARGNVVLGYAKSKIDTANNADSASYTLAYTHSLSKRTSAYAGYQRVSNDGTVRLGTALMAPAATELGGSANTLMGGITHKF